MLVSGFFASRHQRPTRPPPQVVSGAHAGSRCREAGVWTAVCVCSRQTLRRRGDCPSLTRLLFQEQLAGAICELPAPTFRAGWSQEALASIAHGRLCVRLWDKTRVRISDRH